MQGLQILFQRNWLKKLEVISMFEQKVVDGQNEESKLGMGGINFLNAGAAVADLKQSKELGCLQINGFVD